MLIRSKNKMHIVNIENGVVSAEGDGTVTFRAGKIRVVLGEYSSAQKAFKVLDMIQGAYADFENTKVIIPEISKMFRDAPASKANEFFAVNIGARLSENMYFQMPADSDIEE